MPCSQCTWLCVHVEEWSVFFRVPWRFSIRRRAFFLTAPPHARKRAAVGPLWGSSFAERRNGGSRAAGAALTCGGRRAQLCSLRHRQAPCLARLRALRHCWIRGDKQENGSEFKRLLLGKVSCKYYRCDSAEGSTLGHVQPSPGRPEPPADWVKDRFFLWEKVLKISCSEIPELADVPEHRAQAADSSKCSQVIRNISKFG